MRRLAAILLAGLMAAAAVWIALDGDRQITMLSREIRQAGLGDTARVLSVLRWPAVAITAALALTLLSPLVDRMLRRVDGATTEDGGDH
ncbi:MAG: hypothetical protein AAF577_12430 [Pseudomonadota bacterium]